MAILVYNMYEVESMKKSYAQTIKQNKLMSVVPLVMIAALAYTLILTKVFGLNSFLNMDSILDSQLFYTGSHFLDTLSSLSAEEVLAYLYMHLIDYLFIFSFYPVLSFIFDNINKNDSKIVYLPLLAMFFDFSENVIIDVKLLYSIPDIFATVSGICTLLKFSVLLISIVLMLLNIIKNRRKNVKTHI